jgi:hypothetical protein
VIARRQNRIAADDLRQLAAALGAGTDGTL